MRNALHVPSKSCNLIPPFIMREAGLVVNDVPLIHTDIKDLMDETHCIVSTKKAAGTNLNIPMKLGGIFLYFDTQKLTEEEIESCKYIETVRLSLGGASWDPYDTCYSNQEESIIDF